MPKQSEEVSDWLQLKALGEPRLAVCNGLFSGFTFLDSRAVTLAQILVCLCVLPGR